MCASWVKQGIKKKWLIPINLEDSKFLLSLRLEEITWKIYIYTYMYDNEYDQRMSPEKIPGNKSNTLKTYAIFKK